MSLTLVGYLLFTLLWTAWLVNSRDANSYSFSQLVRARVTGSELLPSEDAKQTRFHDVASLEQVQQYLRGPLLEALFGDQASRVTGEFDEGWVNLQARLVGSARIRQIRVATNSCRVSLLRVLSPTCYPSLSDGTRRHAPIYGENLGGGMRRAYHYAGPGEPTSAFFTASLIRRH